MKRAALAGSLVVTIAVIGAACGGGSSEPAGLATESPPAPTRTDPAFYSTGSPCRNWSASQDYGANLDSADPSTSGLPKSIWDLAMTQALEAGGVPPGSAEELVELVDRACELDPDLPVGEAMAFLVDQVAEEEAEEDRANRDFADNFLCDDWLNYSVADQRDFAKTVAAEFFPGGTDEVVRFFAETCTEETRAVSPTPALLEAIERGDLR